MSCKFWEYGNGMTLTKWSSVSDKLITHIYPKSIWFHIGLICKPQFNNKNISAKGLVHFPYLNIVFTLIMIIQMGLCSKLRFAVFNMVQSPRLMHTVFRLHSNQALNEPLEFLHLNMQEFQENKCTKIFSVRLLYKLPNVYSFCCSKLIILLLLFCY